MEPAIWFSLELTSWNPLNAIESHCIKYHCNETVSSEHCTANYLIKLSIDYNTQKRLKTIDDTMN